MVALKPIFRSELKTIDEGSRNAVVALKHGLGCPPGSLLLRSRNAVVALKLHGGHDGGTPPSAKQERRGGIETPTQALNIRLADNEAGTPWWH